MAEAFERRDNGVESLESRYRHLDERVGRLGQEVAGISATLSQVSHTLETISRRVNEPQRTQWSAIIAACAFIASLGYSALVPVKEQTEKNGEEIKAVVAQQRDVAEMAGGFKARMETSAKEHERTDAIIMQLSTRIYEGNGRAGAAEARINALEEKLRDVGMAGSRKWIAPPH